MIQIGYPVEWAAWFGLVAPAGTPADVIAKLHSEFRKAASDPDFAKAMVEEGINLMQGTPQAFGDLIAKDIPRMATIVKEFDIKGE